MNPLLLSQTNRESFYCYLYTERRHKQWSAAETSYDFAKSESWLGIVDLVKYNKPVNICDINGINLKIHFLIAKQGEFF